MKYCTHCGAEIFDDAVVCVKCGRSVETHKPITAEVQQVPQTDDTMITVVKVFLILGCISQGWLIIPLAWCLPITISIFNSFKEKRAVSTGMKVCSLIFVSLVAGVCLLCIDDNAR